MIRMNANILSNERLNQDCWRMVLDAPQMASEVKPGQFIHLKIGGSNGPLFRRPFSVFRRVELEGDSLGIEIIYKVTGRGTHLMAELRKGDLLDIIGPLGLGFGRNPGKKVHILLGGGVGSATLFMLGEEISEKMRGQKIELKILLGETTSKDLILEKEFRTLNGEVWVSTDDGTYGYHGLVTEMLKDYIDHGKIPSDCAIYACGPEAMLRALVSICKQYEIPAQVSMERHMMCGIGACLACVCKVDQNHVLRHRDLGSSHIQFVSDKEFGYALVCKDGPVFDINEVIFDD